MTLTLEAAEQAVTLFSEIVTTSLDQEETIARVQSVRRLLNADESAVDIKQVVIMGTDVGERIRQLEERLQRLEGRAQAQDGYYSMEQFLTRLTVRRGRAYATRTDYITASRMTPNARPVSTGDFRIWQREGLVPAWAYDQIDQLIWPERKQRRNPLWSVTERDALCEIYNADPSRTNTAIALMLTERFNRLFTEQTVRAQLHRLRRKELVSKYRKSA